MFCNFHSLFHSVIYLLQAITWYFVNHFERNAYRYVYVYIYIFNVLWCDASVNLIYIYIYT